MEERNEVQIAKLDTAHCVGGEGPLWDTAEQALYFIDNFGKKAHRYDPTTGKTRSWDMPDVITALALRTGGGAVVTLRSGIHLLDLTTGALECLSPLPEPRPHGFNDGKVDRRGRFMIGASTANIANPTPDGGLLRLDPDHQLTKLDHGVHFSNGPCWSPDDKTFYFSDSWLKNIYAYDYDIATGGVSNKRVFVNTADLGGVPDGATVDSDGRLWVAIYGGGKLATFSPDGTLERTIAMPVRLVSSVAFGGANLDRLFVTTIAHGIHGDPVEEGAGHVYMVDGLNVKGIPEPRFAG
jgi:L-arabinonolactonase